MQIGKAGQYFWRNEDSLCSHYNEQNERFPAFWQRNAGWATVIIEIGAGRTALRIFGLALAQRDRCRSIRINPREAHTPAPHLSVAATGLQALRAIDRELKNIKRAAWQVNPFAFIVNELGQ